MFFYCSISIISKKTVCLDDLCIEMDGLFVLLVNRGNQGHSYIYKWIHFDIN